CTTDAQCPARPAVYGGFGDPVGRCSAGTCVYACSADYNCLDDDGSTGKCSGGWCYHHGVGRYKTTTAQCINGNCGPSGPPCEQYKYPPPPPGFRGNWPCVEFW